MCPQQPLFHDLVSRSPDNMHTARYCLIEHETSKSIPFTDIIKRTNFRHRDDSIDEILEMYRPTLSSILDCIACLDDSTSFSTYTGRQDSMERESELISSVNFRDPTDSTYEASPFKAAPTSQRKSDSVLKRNHSDKTSDSHEITADRRERRRRVMSIQEKEDRRRDQNREAQRRYRERNMLSSTNDMFGRQMIH